MGEQELNRRVLELALRLGSPAVLDVWLGRVADGRVRSREVSRLNEEDCARLVTSLRPESGRALMRSLSKPARGRLVSRVSPAQGSQLLDWADEQRAASLIGPSRALDRGALSTALPSAQRGALDDALPSPEQTGSSTELVDEETTADIQQQGATAPPTAPYLETSAWQLWKKRISWLLLLFVAEAYTGTVLRAFENELETVVALAFFIPLIIGTGGNTGTQITTTLVRAIAAGEVRLADARRVIVKELGTASLIGASMAIAGFVRAVTLGVGMEIVFVVTLTLAAIVVWSAIISSLLPLLLSRTPIDPAVVSAPMIATIVDGTGLVIYFLIAKALIPALG